MPAYLSMNGNELCRVSLDDLHGDLDLRFVTRMRWLRIWIVDVHKTTSRNQLTHNGRLSQTTRKTNCRMMIKRAARAPVREF